MVCVATEQPSGESEVLGANDRVQLAAAERFIKRAKSKL